MNLFSGRIRRRDGGTFREVGTVSDDHSLPDSADVVVLGGGIIGVSAAYFLAKKGLSVALVEKGVIAGEQSSRNWGWCRKVGRTMSEAPLAHLSLKLWANLTTDVGANTGFKQSGMVVVTRDSTELARWESWAQEAWQQGIDVQVLSSDNIERMIPGLRQQFCGGLYSKTDGYAEPSKAVPAIALAAARLGVTIHQFCAARGVERTNGKISAVITEKGVIRTSRLLCAGGVWSSMFCRSMGISLPQASVFGTACRTSPIAEPIRIGFGTDGFTIRPRDDGGYTLGMRGRGHVELTPQGLLYANKFLPLFLKRRKNLSLGVGRSFFSGPESRSDWSPDEKSPFEEMRILDTAPDQTLINEGLSQLKHCFPSLHDVGVSAKWGGLIDSLPDTLPVIDAVRSLPGLYLATGFSGRGFGIGPGAGSLVADLIVDDRPSLDPTPFRYSRFMDGSRNVIPSSE